MCNIKKMLNMQNENMLLKHTALLHTCVYTVYCSNWDRHFFPFLELFLQAGEKSFGILFSIKAYLQPFQKSAKHWVRSFIQSGQWLPMIHRLRSWKALILLSWFLESNIVWICAMKSSKVKCWWSPFLRATAPRHLSCVSLTVKQLRMHHLLKCETFCRSLNCSNIQ